MRLTRQSRMIGAREAQSILGISRSRLLTLANGGELAGSLVDRIGAPRHWVFRRSDVLSLLARGNYLRRRAKKRRQAQLWEQYFGLVPAGYAPAFRDGDRANVAPANLCLLSLRTPRQQKSAPRRRVRMIEWTKDKLAFLRREYQTTPSRELADVLGVSLAALTRQAMRMGLRKPAAYLREQAQRAHRLPIGTERIRDHTDTIWIKVAHEGPWEERWRPKHHVIWEQATSQTVPRGFRVVFKDGDKRNFKPDNLELATRGEIFARAFAQHLSYPEPLRAAARLTRKLQREIERQRRADPERATASRRRATRTKRIRRWTPQMDAVLVRNYPTKPAAQLTAELGVSLQSLRNRARRLRVHRSHAAIISEASAMAALEKARWLRNRGETNARA